MQRRNTSCRIHKIYGRGMTRIWALVDIWRDLRGSEAHFLAKLVKILRQVAKYSGIEMVIWITAASTKCGNQEFTGGDFLTCVVSF
jgi:hypothetical protein